MQLRTLIVGIAVTAILVVVLGVTRLMGVTLEEEVYELEKIEMVSLEAPPEPIEPPEEVVQELAPLPPPTFENLSTAIDIDVPAIPHSEARFDPTMQVEMFSADIAPAEIHVAETTTKPIIKPSTSKPRKPEAKPRERAYYSLSDLDGVPRELRKGRFRWPSGVSGQTAKAVAYVELDERGRCQLISIKSISNKKFEKAVKQVLSGYRFTKPTKGGEPAKARFDFPITLEKP